MTKNPTQTREYAVEAAAALAALSLGNQTAETALVELLCDAAESGEAGVVCEAIGNELGGDVLWKYVYQAEDLEAERRARKTTPIGNVRETQLPPLAEAYFLWTAHHELGREPWWDPEEGRTLTRGQGAVYRRTERVTEALAWGAHSVGNPAVLAQALPQSPRGAQVPILRRYHTLCGPDATEELLEEHSAEIFPFAAAMIRHEISRTATAGAR